MADGAIGHDYHSAKMKKNSQIIAIFCKKNDFYCSNAA